MPRLPFTSRLAPHLKVTEEQSVTEEAILAFGENLRALNRRRFLSTLAAAGAVAGAGGMLSTQRAEAQSTAPTVVDVLNFALNLEFLEANFYIAAANNANSNAVPALTTAQTGIPGNITNLPTVVLTDPTQQQVAVALSLDETNHINLLRSTITQLGGTPINEPDIDYSAGGTMPPVTTNVAFFAAARQFTAVGNSAYAGGAASLVSQPGVLQAAAQILGAESQHQGVINGLCILLGITTPVPDKKLDAQDVPPTDSTAIFTITPIPSPVTAAMPPASGIARTPQQVLGIVYGVSTPTTTTPMPGTAKGGFYPTGVKGNILST